MKLVEFIEELYWQRNVISDELYLKIYDTYKPDKWIEVTNIYLCGLERKHSVPGKTIETLMGISDFYLKTKNMSPSQSKFLVANLIKYWDQITLITRMNIGLQ